MTTNNKIAFVTPFYLPARLSGSGVVIRQLAEGLSQKGYNCSVITSNGLNTRWWYDPVFGKRIKKRFEIINGVKVHRLSCKQIISFFSLALVRYFKPFLSQNLYHKLEFLHCGPNLVGLPRLLIKEKFTIIYSSPLPAYLNKQVVNSGQKLLPQAKLILGPLFHEKLPNYHNPELKKIFDKVDLIHVATNSEKKGIQEIFQVADEKFICIPHFLNLTKRRKQTAINQGVKQFKSKFKLKNKKIVLFAAGKIYEKGAFTLLNVMNKLYKKDTSYRLITIGNNTPAWNKRTKKLRADFLIDLGFVNEEQKEIIFTACDIFCLPSLAESFGLTYLEAWYKKKPVIGADIPPVKEFIQSTRAGLLVEFGNEKSLAEAIEKLMLNQRLAKQLGKNGYQSLMQNYTFKNVSNNYQKLFSFSS